MNFLKHKARHSEFDSESHTANNQDYSDETLNQIQGNE